MFAGFREGLGQVTSSHEPHVCLRTKDFRNIINTYLGSQSGLSNFGFLHFLSLLLFLSSRLPSCRIPSCWMDGIRAICLSTKKNSHGESERRQSKAPQVKQLYTFLFVIPFGYPCDRDIPLFDFFPKYLELESPLARAELHHQH